MPEESDRFNDVNKTWNDIMSFTIQNPQILIIIEYPDIMSTLQKSNIILEGIKKGLNSYLEKKRLVFPRYYKSLLSFSMMKRSPFLVSISIGNIAFIVSAISCSCL